MTYRSSDGRQLRPLCSSATVRIERGNPAADIKGNLVICHQYRCVFVHIPKCAGQSVEHIFLKAVGLTWATRAPLLMRHNKRPELGPPRLAHLTASQYVTCKHMTPQQFARYFKFAIVRNPWDRMVSFYKYLGAHKGLDFKQFLMGDFLHQLWNNKYWFVRPQVEYIYDDNDSCLVDYIGRFELLSVAMEHVAKRVGLQNASVPHVNRSSGNPRSNDSDKARKHEDAAAGYLKQEKSAKDDYRAYYDNESIHRVVELYRCDIEMFGYEFDPLPKGHVVEVPTVK